MFAYGNNLQTAGPNFHHRKFYDNKIMPINENEPSINKFDTYIDIFVNKPFYGRIDNFSNSVFSAKTLNLNSSNNKFFIPLEEKSYMKKFKNTDIYAMNFVVDAFEDMAGFFNRSCQTTKDLAKSGPFSSIEPKFGWTSPIERYFDFLREIYIIYRNYLIIPNQQDLKKIKNFDNFLDSFYPFLIKNTESFSILFSSFMLSKHVHPGTSGLMVETAIDDHSDDYIKTSVYLSDKNYLFFKNSALRFGFYVDRNTPWRLFANISSNNMLPYMKKYGLNSVDDVFSNQYIKSHEYDLFLLRMGLSYIYNLFLGDYPTYNEINVVRCEEKIETKNRLFIPFEDVKKKYPYEKFINLYISLRAKSVRFSLEDPNVIYVKKHASAMIKNQGLEKTLNFINNKFNTYKNILLEKEYFTSKNLSDINIP